jgi:hypothetical protein
MAIIDREMDGEFVNPRLGGGGLESVKFSYLCC